MAVSMKVIDVLSSMLPTTEDMEHEQGHCAVVSVLTSLEYEYLLSVINSSHLPSSPFVTGHRKY